jgi:hypothetical protein
MDIQTKDLIINFIKDTQDLKILNDNIEIITIINKNTIFKLFNNNIQTICVFDLDNLLNYQSGLYNITLSDESVIESQLIINFKKNKLVTKSFYLFPGENFNVFYDFIKLNFNIISFPKTIYNFNIIPFKSYFTNNIYNNFSLKNILIKMYYFTSTITSSTIDLSINISNSLLIDYKISGTNYLLNQTVYPYGLTDNNISLNLDANGLNLLIGKNVGLTRNLYIFIVYTSS